MSGIDTNSDPAEIIRQLNRQLSELQRYRVGVDRELVSIGTKLDEFIGSVETISQRFKELKMTRKAGPAAAAPGAGVPAAGMSLDDFKVYIEKLLQGSLEAASDKISTRIMSMLKELKGLAGTAREAKILEIREIAASEMVDLSKLFTHDEAQSNLGEVGVEEKESKAIDSSLEKLKKMRGLKPKSGDAPKE